MRLPELLRSIDGLSYGQRVRLLADQAPQLVSLLGELGRGTAFERVLGLQIAEITRETSYVGRMLRDPDPSVQNRALAAVRRGVPIADDDLRIVYDDAPAALRSKLVALVRRQRREHLAVRLIDEHRARWGDVAATGLLDATDHATVARLLPELAYCVTPGGWRQLAKHHPDEVLAFARQTLPANDEWWQSVGHGVTASLEHAPDAVLELIKQAVPAHELPVAVLDIIGPLTDRDQAGVLDLLLAPDRRSAVTRALTPAFRRRLHRYSDDELIALGRVLWPQLASFLDTLEPSRRAVVFAAVTQYVDLGQAQLSTELLQVLPHAVRVEQARRMLALPAVEDGWWRRAITGHLPFDEAFALLSAEVSDPDAAVRSSVYQGVVRSAGYGRRPEQVVQAVTWVAGRIRNDQDTVRVNALQAVAELPPTLLTDALTESLDTLLTDALAARDTSWATRHALTQLAENAVVQGVLRHLGALLDWGLQAHSRLSENRGRIDLDPLIDRLPRGREADVYEALRPAIEAGAKRDEFSLAFTVAAALGRRRWWSDHLAGVLEQAVWSDQEYVSEQASRYWLEPPQTRYDRLRQIVDRDVTMARWQPVWWLVTEHYTDLLDPVLVAADRIRRFDRSSTSWQVPDYALRRWLPRQQARYAELLVQAARDDRMHTWYRSLAIRTLGRVPVVGRAALDEFLGSSDVLLQEAALAALAWTERPDLAMPLLLAHAGDDRARVAVYAASRAARFVRPSLLPGLLQPVLSGERVKVTSRKEAVRLLGELRAPGASAVLTEAWSGAHRDVRAAIARTVSQYLLYDPAAWAVLEQAVHDSPATATALTVRRAYDVPVGYRTRYADLLIAVTTRSEPEVVGPALLALRGWARYNPAATRVCADFITRLSLRSRVWRDAITALVSFVATDAPAGLDDVIDVARLLVRSEANPELPNALPDRDHPARQRLTFLVSQLSSQFSRRSAEDRRHLRVVADELAGSDFLDLRLQLLVHSQSAEDLRDLVGDDPLAALKAAELVAGRLSATESTWTPAGLLPVADSLAHSPDLASGLLAHALVSAAAPRAGWPTEWRTLLIALRNHPSPATRRRALDLTTTTE
ncbi:HEAT repeat domain-containing protein [Kribbella speibonae]|uniref:HEAT repeat domain-containing protein n=1 Tax=Kribbella speibonae TaxID=1572660 RepID=A0A4V2M554_9ACTN|nr:HEAT repeat domain-containing protein [Kribbella speibonae]TCC38512.1 HEAT repeat domain-containing protein [Kribbella speibonae]